MRAWSWVSVEMVAWPLMPGRAPGTFTVSAMRTGKVVTSASVPAFFTVAFLAISITCAGNRLSGKASISISAGIALVQVDHLVLAHLDLHLHAGEGGDDDDGVLVEVGAAHPLAHLLQPGGEDAVDGGGEGGEGEEEAGLRQAGAGVPDAVLGRLHPRHGAVALGHDLLELGGAGAVLP